MIKKRRTHRFRNCNKLEAQVTPAREPILERAKRMAAVAMEGAMATVVEAKDIAAATVAGTACETALFSVLQSVADGAHAANQPLGWPHEPITRDERPHDGPHLKGASRGNNPRIAK